MSDNSAQRRGGDLVSAAVVYFGARRMGVAGFAAANVALTLVWLGVAVLILRRHRALARVAQAAMVGVIVGLSALGAAAPARAQTRGEQPAVAPVETDRHLATTWTERIRCQSAAHRMVRGVRRDPVVKRFSAMRVLASVSDR